MDLEKSILAVQSYGMFGFIRDLPFFIRPQNVLEIRDACLTYLESDVRGKLRISNLNNPSTVRQTESFSLHVLDENGNMLAKTDADLRLSASSFSAA